MTLLTRLCLWAQARNRSTQIWRSLVWLALNLNTWSTKSIIETTQIFKKETLTRHAWSLAYNRMSEFVTHLPTRKVDWKSLSILFTWHHHRPCQLLTAPASTIPGENFWQWSTNPTDLSSSRWYSSLPASGSRTNHLYCHPFTTLVNFESCRKWAIVSYS